MIGFKSHSDDTQGSRPKKAHDNPVYRGSHDNLKGARYLAVPNNKRPAFAQFGFLLSIEVLLAGRFAAEFPRQA
jgi:hypothetical protein